LKERWLSKFQAMRERLVLTSQEKRVVIFILVAVGLGLAVRHCRDMHSETPAKIDKKQLRARIQHRSPSSSASPKRNAPKTEKKNRNP
jgi:hypothetical protein